METCGTCSKTVYPMEKLSVDGAAFHKACFRCKHCNCVLSLGKYAAMSNEYYCKPHFAQLFRTKGSYNFAASGEGTPASPDSATPTRPLRRKSSIAETVGMMKELSPDQCHTAQQVFDAFDLDQDKQLSRNELKHLLLTCKPKMRPFQAEQQSRVKMSEFHAASENFLTFEEFKGLFAELVIDEDFDASLRSQARADPSSGGSPASGASSSSGGAAARFGSAGESCSVCNKTVYPMDKVSAEGVILHKACFRCLHCSKTLSLGNYAAMGGKYYCKPHFKQLFALKGSYHEGFGEENPKAKWQAGGAPAAGAGGSPPRGAVVASAPASSSPEPQQEQAIESHDYANVITVGDE